MNITNLIAIFDEGFADNLFARLLIGIAPILVLVVLFTIALRLASRRSKIQRKTDQMLADEEAANLTRLKEISEDFFYTPDLSELPIKEYPAGEAEKGNAVYSRQKKVMDTSEKKMIRFGQNLSNVELKTMFGVSNLEFVARYEENFTNFIHALRHWAEALMAADQIEDAKKVLEAANGAGSEISQTYTLLADIYAAQNDGYKLKELLALTEQSPLAQKEPVINHIKQAGRL
jgi:tetratricopeptide (TPR) repeat protein